MQTCVAMILVRFAKNVRRSDAVKFIRALLFPSDIIRFPLMSTPSYGFDQDWAAQRASGRGSHEILGGKHPLVWKAIW